MTPSVEFCVDKDRLLEISNLFDQAIRVESPDFKINISQEGEFLIVPLIKFELKAQR